jgi:Zn finger protein HypA/HybF involved in hydrogenase expression
VATRRQLVKIALAHGDYPAREVVARGISHKLNTAGRTGAEVLVFSCVENLLVSSMDYEVFVVYNDFKKKMGGLSGIREIRRLKPEVLIIGVSATPNYDRKMLPAGADAFVLLAGNEITETAELIYLYTGRPDLRCKKCDRGLVALLECREFKDYMLWVYHCPKCEQNYMVNVDKNRRIPIVRYLTDILQDGLEKHSRIIANTKDVLVEYPHPEEILWIK